MTSWVPQMERDEKKLGNHGYRQQLTDKMHFEIAIEEFANKKARKVTVQKIVQ